jgi:TPR repeat protein
VKRAEAGDAKAQCDLGVFYYKGDGVTQDYKEAVKWLTKSAEQGNLIASYILGHCYYFGKGVAKDEKEAKKWWKKR